MLPHPTNPEHAAIVGKLSDMLTALPIGGILTWDAATEAVQRDIRTRHRYLLMAARERAEKALGCIFEAVRGEGLKRLSASDSPEIGLSAIRRVRKAAKRGVRRLERINANSLSEPEVKRVIGYRAMLGAIAMIADGNKARTVSAVIDPTNPIPPKSILEMFKD